VVTVIVDATEDKMTFEVNGKLLTGEMTGIASSLPLYPAINFTGTSREVKLLTGSCHGCWSAPATSLYQLLAVPSVVLPLHAVSRTCCWENHGTIVRFQPFRGGESETHDA
jgi:hypothetical protein